MEIRKAKEADLDEILSLFKQTVIEINKKNYSSVQIEAWSSSAEDKDRWLKKIETQHFLVALTKEKMVGFGSVIDGYLDTMFVHKDHQGEGVASKIYSELESLSFKNEARELTTEASITARPFFEKQGFKVVEKQKVNRKGIEITNFKMIKRLR